MRILLDESVPQKLRLLIGGGHVVETTWYQGWSGLKNGALLEAAERAGFEGFLTADQELAYQQNLAGRRIAVIVLGTKNWGVIRERVDVIVCGQANEEELIRVSAARRACGGSPRPPLRRRWRGLWGWGIWGRPWSRCAGRNGGAGEGLVASFPANSVGFLALST